MRIQRIHFKVVSHSRNGGDSGRNTDAPFRQPLFAQAAGNAQWGCQPPGEMTAACRILKAAIFDLRGVVGVSRTGAVFQVGVVAGTGIGVVDDGGNRRAAGKAIQDACQKLRPVSFLPGGGPVILSRCAAVQKGL